MKKLISIMLAGLLIIATAFVLTACGTENASVSSEMTISGDFNGSRLITVKYPLSSNIDAVKDTLLADEHITGVEGVTFSYKGVEEDGYYFELRFDFYNKADYEREVKAVIGRSASSFLSRKDTVLTKCTRMTENFDVSDLIAWITRTTAAESSTKDIGFNYDTNTVTIGDKKYQTGSTVNISEVEGDRVNTVNSVGIHTSKNEEGLYDRRFVFSVPNQVYREAKDDFDQYFEANTSTGYKFCDWSAEGANMLYTVKYEGLSLRDLTYFTSKLLDTENVSITYDKDNKSTPLSEGHIFEESLDTFSFIGPNKGVTPLLYTYILPPNTVHGDCSVFEDGQWTNKGSWEDGEYKLEFNTGAMQLRIPDGNQYTVQGVDFWLESLGGERFRRTTSFLYSKTDGSEGMNYAYSFFTDKGAQATTGEDDENLICSVVTEGTTSEISKELNSLFGGDNYMSYRQNSGTFALSTKTTFIDHINLDSIMNSSNAGRPMRYFIRSSGGENIVSVSLDGGETAYKSAEKSVLTLNGSTATVEYHGSIPITSHVVLYLLFGLLLLGATVTTVYIMLRRRRPSMHKGAQEIVDAVGADDDDDALASLTQTTTFSIAELGVLSRNKRYVEEINKDIEERMEADRLNERKKEIREKELAEMERKVYGTDKGETAEDDTPADDADLDMDYATEILTEAANAADRKEEEKLPGPDAETDAEPEKEPEEEPAPEPQEKVNPFSLLDETDEEDDI